jgi:hypothetical protein
MKFKPAKKRKYYAGELYIFVGGKAKIPGFRGKHCTITLKEFNEFKAQEAKKEAKK